MSWLWLGNEMAQLGRRASKEITGPEPNTEVGKGRQQPIRGNRNREEPGDPSLWTGKEALEAPQPEMAPPSVSPSTPELFQGGYQYRGLREQERPPVFVS
uniref:Uncharacterized protein n=1 Tax=Mustela putorius furo TaxID=9669 RepID=M3XRE5_MUSPF